jgi:hypothetical protein
MNPSDEPVSARPEEIESLLERVRRNQLGEQDLRLWERLLRLLRKRPGLAASTFDRAAAMLEADTRQRVSSTHDE